MSMVRLLNLLLLYIQSWRYFDTLHHDDQLWDGILPVKWAAFLRWIWWSFLILPGDLVTFEPEPKTPDSFNVVEIIHWQGDQGGGEHESVTVIFASPDERYFSLKWVAGLIIRHKQVEYCDENNYQRRESLPHVLSTHVSLGTSTTPPLLLSLRTPLSTDFSVKACRMQASSICFPIMQLQTKTRSTN